MSSLGKRYNFVVIAAVYLSGEQNFIVCSSRKLYQLCSQAR